MVREGCLKDAVFFLDDLSFPIYALTESAAKELEKEGWRRCTYEEWEKAIGNAAVPAHLSFLGKVKHLLQRDIDGQAGP